jgi:hypothetical protein
MVGKAKAERRFKVRTFHMKRISDKSLVGEGTIFSSGKCVVQWEGRVAVYDSLSDVEKVQGHRAFLHSPGVCHTQESAMEALKARGREFPGGNAP